MYVTGPEILTIPVKFFFVIHDKKKAKLPNLDNFSNVYDQFVSKLKLLENISFKKDAFFSIKFPAAMNVFN